MKLQAILICSLTAALVAAATTLPAAAQFVTVGDPGNPDDPSDGDSGRAGVQNCGAVSYTYAIGTYEVTISQYTAFLNAVAATDTYDLYNPSMATDLNSAGILRLNSPGSYSYSVIPGTGNKPVTYVSFYDAMRYANWLGTGNTETGAYTLLGGMPAPSNGLTVTRNGGAQFWIPSEDEWYKAAYYDTTVGAGGGDNYWLYPMRSDTVPTSNTPGAGTNRGNFYDGDFAVTQSGSYDPGQNYLTDAGAYTDSASYYGTYDQGGNVSEWNDTIFEDSRGVRGGFQYALEIHMRSSDRSHSYPPGEGNSYGFRVATVPEPAVSVSLILAGGMLLARRKRPSAL